MKFDGLLPWFLFVLTAPLLVAIGCCIYLYMQLKDC